jgi:hypothetical protein
MKMISKSTFYNITKLSVLSKKKDEYANCQFQIKRQHISIRSLTSVKEIISLRIKVIVIKSLN